MGGGLTCEAGETLVGDGRFAQVEHLQFVQVLGNELQTRITKLQLENKNKRFEMERENEEKKEICT